MKKITMKKEFLGERICYTFFGVGAGLMFLGVMLAVIENSITLSIGVISICVGIGMMIIAGLAQNEGVLGLIFGIMLTISITAFMLYPLIGILPWLPNTEATQTTLLSIALPLILAGGGGTVAVKIFIIFI